MVCCQKQPHFLQPAVQRRPGPPPPPRERSKPPQQVTIQACAALAAAHAPAQPRDSAALSGGHGGGSVAATRLHALAAVDVGQMLSFRTRPVYACSATFWDILGRFGVLVWR